MVQACGLMVQHCPNFFCHWAKKKKKKKKKEKKNTHDDPDLFYINLQIRLLIVYQLTEYPIIPDVLKKWKSLPEAKTLITRITRMAVGV